MLGFDVNTRHYQTIGTCTHTLLLRRPASKSLNLPDTSGCKTHAHRHILLRTVWLDHSPGGKIVISLGVHFMNGPHISRKRLMQHVQGLITFAVLRLTNLERRGFSCLELTKPIRHKLLVFVHDEITRSLNASLRTGLTGIILDRRHCRSARLNGFKYNRKQIHLT